MTPPRSVAFGSGKNLRMASPAGLSCAYHLARKGQLLKRYLDRHQLDCSSIWLNVPPAVVRRLRFG